MRVFHGFDNLPQFRCGVATIGSFDGVHCGHRVLLDRVRSIATEQGGESIVLTFEPHPRITLGKAEGLRLLSSTDEKLHLLEAEGIDNVIIIPFTHEFSQLSPAEFLHNMLVAKADIKFLVVGYNHHFGHNKAGGFDFLSENSAGLQVVRVDQHRVESDKVSSTVIRAVIERGDMNQAAHLLGHPYIIIGTATPDGAVIYQEQEYKQLPPAGTYRVRANNIETGLTIGSDSSLRLASSIPQTSEQLIIEF